MLLVALMVAAALPATATDNPVVVPGNPTCADLGYAFGFKPQPEPPPSGTYTIPGTTFTITIVSDGTNASWTSTLPIDAVIFKGGPQANVYTYNPEATSGSGHPPANASGDLAAISHLEFCYDFEVAVSKTAQTTYTRTYTWDISKSVDVDTHNLFAGQSASSGYTVMVNRYQADTDFAVSGVITITNPAPAGLNATVTAVTDVISGGINASVTCPATPFVVSGGGGSVQCTYTASLPDSTSRVNTATASTTGAVGGGSGTADVIFGAPTTIVGDDTVTVSDQFGNLPANGLGSSNGNTSATFNYARSFTCPTNASAYDANGFYSATTPNTATIDQTGQNASESVTLNCYAPVVSKDASTSLTRTWNWTIDKSADQTSLTLSTGQLFPVNYAVALGASSADSNWAVTGTITVVNPNPYVSMTVSLTDSVGGMSADLDCGGALVVPPGGSATCGYSAALPDGSNRTNTATASLNGGSFSGTAAVSFQNATVTEIDECVSVGDSLQGTLGNLCANHAPASFTYTRLIGYDTCGNRTVDNIATFTTNDTGSTGSDTWSVSVNVPCAGGCTLTLGYWKTHSDRGPAPYDNTWALLDANGDNAFLGEDEPLFGTGQTWYQVFWTAPAGNPYYILAHQYMAAVLNQLNGASVPPTVQTALNQAAILLATYDGNPQPMSNIKGSVRTQFLTLATLLDQYNNGIIGPGHCSE
jgi:hypothetical protein